MDSILGIFFTIFLLTDFYITAPVIANWHTFKKIGHFQYCHHFEPTPVKTELSTVAYSESCQTSKIDLFEKILQKLYLGFLVESFIKKLAITVESSMILIWTLDEYLIKYWKKWMTFPRISIDDVTIPSHHFQFSSF